MLHKEKNLVSVCRNNENISLLYISYQFLFLVLSLLGPGTIFLMIVGALEIALSGRITMWLSFSLNLIPIIIYIILCFTAKCDTQVITVTGQNLFFIHKV